MKRHIFAGLRIIISFGALALLFFLFRNKLDDIWITLKKTNIFLFSLALIFHLSSLGIITFRLRYILGIQDVRIKLKPLYSLGLIGLFFNNFLPSAVGGDAVKAYYAYKHSGKREESFTSVFIDRMTGLLAIIFLAFLAYLYYQGSITNPRVKIFIYALICGSLFMLLFFASRRVARRFTFLKVFTPSEKWRNKIAEIYHAINSYKHHLGIMFGCFVLSVAAQLVFITVNFLLALSLGINLQFGLFLLLIPIITALSMIPSVNGLGIREGAYVYFFGSYIAGEDAFALSILYYALTLMVSVIGGIVYAFWGGVSYKEVEEEEND